MAEEPPLDANQINFEAVGSFPLEPGYCSTCGTINAYDWMECGNDGCFWVKLLPGWPNEEEPRRAA